MRIREALGILVCGVFCFYVKAQSTTDPTGLPKNHCSELFSTLDGKTSACMVWDNDEQKFSNPTQIEIYRDSQLALRIETDAPIREWHFWEGGNQLSVHVGKRDDPGAYELFDLTSGERIGKLDSVSSASALPQWAKGRAQLDDESVPEGPVYSEQRTLWIGKVIRQVGAISPGMTRTELLRIFRTQGGIYTREQQTFVLRECNYIKVDVVFSPANDEAEDRIVRISRPYLDEYFIAD